MLRINNKTEWLLQARQASSRSIFIYFNNERWTFARFNNESEILAKKMFSTFIRKNMLISVKLENPFDFFLTITSLWKIGAIPCLISTRNTKEETSKIMEDVNSSILIDNKSLKIIRQYKYPVTVGNFKFKAQNNAIILFTSGSTDKPKAVPLTFSNLYNSVVNIDEMLNFERNNKWLCSLPHYHIGGFMIFVRALLSESKLILVDNFKSSTLSHSINKNKVNFVSLVQTTMSRLLRLNNINTSSLKATFLGGGKISSSTFAKAVSNGWKPIKVYGSSETSSMVTALLSDEFAGREDSAGRVVRGAKLKIIDPDSSGIGEIAIKSKSITKGYLNYSNECMCKNGYFLTGDIGFLDSEKFLYILGRKENFIISGGEKIIAAEVEEVINSFPLIKESYIVGINDEEWGEIACAVIVSNAKINEEILIQYLRSHLSDYKIPKRIKLVKTIHKNELGKVERQKLKELFN